MMCISTYIVHGFFSVQCTSTNTQCIHWHVYYSTSQFKWLCCGSQQLIGLHYIIFVFSTSPCMILLHGRSRHSKETQATSSIGNRITFTVSSMPSKALDKAETEQSCLDPISCNNLIHVLSNLLYVKVQDPTPSKYATIAAVIVKRHPFLADILPGVQCYACTFSILNNYIAHAIHLLQHFTLTDHAHIVQQSVKKQLSQRLRNLRT